MAKASDKQVGYAMSLMGKAGYSTRYMGAEHKTLGATMKERSGSVEAWLENMDRKRISDLIGQLKEAEQCDTT